LIAQKKRKKELTLDDKEFLAKKYMQNNIKKKRLLDKIDKFLKWIRTKLRNLWLKEKNLYENDVKMTEATEEQWNERASRQINRVLAHGDVAISKLAKFFSIRMTELKLDNKEAVIFRLYTSQ
jgi:hypothetical protein